MSLLLKRSADRIAPLVLRQALACLLAAVAVSGCSWPGGLGLTERSIPPRDPASTNGTVDETPRSNSTAVAGDSIGDRVVFARGDDDGRSVWIRSIRSPADDSPQPPTRWRYPDLEDLLARPARRRPDLRRYLADEDPIVAGNAAIALARTGDDRGADQLADAARAPGLKLPMRCAAVEALAGLPELTAVPRLRELLDQYGGRGPYIAELHAELIRGLARHVDPADDRRFVDALQSRAAEVRRVALEAWAAGRRGELPRQVADFQDDPDWQVRAAALRTMARRRHNEAHTHLATALGDHDDRVRLAAIAGLGVLGGRQAETKLRRLMEDGSEQIRGAAVSALAQLGAEQAVIEAAEDESWRVRWKVAQSLGAFRDRDAADLAYRLLEDASSRVQRDAVRALAQWPLEQAGPVLLEAMGKASLLTRNAAAEQLAARWPPAAEFPERASAQRRAAALADLKGRFQQQFSLVDRAALAKAAAGPPPVARPTPRQLAEVERLIGQKDVRALAGYGPELKAALAELVFDQQQVLPEMVYRDVLPRLDPVFAALDRLNSADLSQRRRAADELAQLARDRFLGHLAVARLGQLVLAEPDQLVWRSVLMAVADDPSQSAIELAYAAIGHPSPEVRRRACSHLAAHPHPRHARVLLPALDDTNHAALCAAVRALGALGSLADTEPLRRLLASTNEQIRLETALALTRLGDPAGASALERLAYSADPKIRRRVAQMMGERGDPAFVPTLIRLLDGPASVRRAALESLPKVVGHDLSSSDDHPPATTPEQVQRWKQWFQRREAGLADR